MVRVLVDHELIATRSGRGVFIRTPDREPSRISRPVESAKQHQTERHSHRREGQFLERALPSSNATSSRYGAPEISFPLVAKRLPTFSAPIEGSGRVTRHPEVIHMGVKRPFRRSSTHSPVRRRRRMPAWRTGRPLARPSHSWSGAVMWRRHSCLPRRHSCRRLATTLCHHREDVSRRVGKRGGAQRRMKRPSVPKSRDAADTSVRATSVGGV